MEQHVHAYEVTATDWAGVNVGQLITTVDRRSCAVGDRRSWPVSVSGDLRYYFGTVRAVLCTACWNTGRHHALDGHSGTAHGVAVPRWTPGWHVLPPVPVTTFGGTR